MISTAIRRHLRSHVVGYVALFAALSGTAVAAGGGGTQEATSSASAAKQIKKLKKVVAAQGARIAVLEAKPAPTAPAIGTVDGLDVAASTSPTGGINFGPDTNLYRENSSRLRTDDTFSAGLGAVGSFSGSTLSSLGFELFNAGTGTAFFDTFGNLSMAGELRLDSGRVTLLETADPGTPSANQGWLYVRDNGGTSELVIEWNDSVFVIDAENTPG